MSGGRKAVLSGQTGETLYDIPKLLREKGFTTHRLTLELKNKPFEIVSVIENGVLLGFYAEQNNLWKLLELVGVPDSPIFHNKNKRLGRKRPDGMLIPISLLVRLATVHNSQRDLIQMLSAVPYTYALTQKIDSTSSLLHLVVFEVKNQAASGSVNEKLALPDYLSWYWSTIFEIPASAVEIHYLLAGTFFEECNACDIELTEMTYLRWKKEKENKDWYYWYEDTFQIAKAVQNFKLLNE